MIRYVSLFEVKLGLDLHRYCQPEVMIFGCQLTILKGFNKIELKLIEIKHNEA